jgi:hypothetical protein
VDIERHKNILFYHQVNDSVWSNLRETSPLLHLSVLPCFSTLILASQGVPLHDGYVQTPLIGAAGLVQAGGMGGWTQPACTGVAVCNCLCQLVVQVAVA